MIIFTAVLGSVRMGSAMVSIRGPPPAALHTPGAKRGVLASPCFTSIRAHGASPGQTVVRTSLGGENHTDSENSP